MKNTIVADQLYDKAQGRLHAQLREQLDEQLCDQLNRRLYSPLDNRIAGQFNSCFCRTIHSQLGITITREAL